MQPIPPRVRRHVPPQLAVASALFLVGTLWAGVATAQAGNGPVGLPRAASEAEASDEFQPFFGPPAVSSGQPNPAAHPLVTMDWHGELRTRLDMLTGVRVTTSEPSIAPHLDVRHGESNTLPSDGRMGIGDLRLRLEPVLHVAEWADLRTQIDATQHMVLGGGVGTLLSDRTDGAATLEMLTTETGKFTSRSTIGVRRAWVHVRVLGLGFFDLGRQGDHFGLGMVRNDGRDIFADFQNDVDRIAISADFFGLHLMAARDILFNGPLNTTAANGTSVLTRGTNATSVDGQPRPLQDSADSTRWLLQAESLKAAGEPGFRWGAALTYQSQDNSFYADHGDCGVQQTCDLLIPRTVRLITPQVYFDWSGKLADAPLRFQVEGAFRYGTVLHADERSATDTSKTLAGGGFAGKLEWRPGLQRWGLDLGLASGERAGGFGVNDQDNWRVTAAPDTAPRSFLTGFNFHRGFLVDSILFRDVIGAVANAWYWKPHWQRLLLETGKDEGLSVNAGILAAVAASDNATPGKAFLLGIEPEASLQWNSRMTTAILRTSWLMPGDALAAPSGAEAQAIWRLDAAFRLKF